MNVSAGILDGTMVISSFFFFNNFRSKIISNKKKSPKFR